MMAMLEDLPPEEKTISPDDIDFGSQSVSRAEIQHLSEPDGKQEVRNIDILMDVNLPVSIELGRTKKAEDAVGDCSWFSCRGIRSCAVLTNSLRCSRGSC